MSTTRSPSLPILPGRRLTSFLGRDIDLRLLLTTLAERRLVTLLGSGGVGKTRLAEEAVHTLAEQGDSVAWAELAPIADPAQIGEVIARAVGVGQVPAGDVLDHVITQIAGRGLTLAIDNAEHLIDATADAVHRLLAGCPELTVLVTSREVLAVDGETTVRLDTLAADDAHQLFVHRQRLVTATPSDAHDPAVRRICRRLDGIPLAIELAASRCRALTPDQIADALDDRFTLLTGGPRRALPRQQTLEASVAWSVDLLDDDHRTLLAILGVFAGGFTLDAAVEVVGEALSEQTVRAGVLDLVDRSLVHPAPTALDEPRFRLRETVRAFATRLLSADPDLATATRRGHVERHLRQVHIIRDALRGPEWRRHLTLLDEEVADLTAAIQHATSTDRVSAAVLIGAVWEYWVRRPQIHAMTGRVLTLLEATGTGTTSLAMAAYGVAQMLVWHHHPESGDRIRRWIAGSKGLDGAEQYVVGLQGLMAWLDRGDALIDQDRLLALADRIDDLWITADVHLCLAIANASGGDLRTAMELAETASRQFEDLQASMSCSYAFPLTAIILAAGGRLDRAEQLIAQAWPSLTGSGDELMAAFAVCTEGLLQCLRGELSGAADVPRRAGARLAILSKEPQASLLVLGWWGMTEARLGLGYDDTIEWDGLPRETFRGHAPIRLIRAALGRLHAGDPVGAVALATEAVDAADPDVVGRPGHPSAATRSAALLVLAKARQAAGHPDASTSAHDALERHVEREWVFWPDALDVVAAVDASAGRHDRAVRLLAASDRRRSEMGTVRWPTDQPWVDQVVASLRDAMEDDGFRAAYDAGLQLDQDAAMALARTGRDERPVEGWDALTPAEQETAKLAAQGLSNPDVAEKLFISRNTVKTHLSAAYRKLAVSNRTELAGAVPADGRTAS